MTYETIVAVLITVVVAALLIQHHFAFKRIIKEEAEKKAFAEGIRTLGYDELVERGTYHLAEAEKYLGQNAKAFHALLAQAYLVKAESLKETSGK
jgi:hypothetical protein